MFVILLKQNLTSIDPRVREIILNLTLMALGPKLSVLDAEGFRLWFQVYLPLFLPSIQSNTFEIIPRNISCESYQAMWVTMFFSSLSYCSGNGECLLHILVNWWILIVFAVWRGATMFSLVSPWGRLNRFSSLQWTILRDIHSQVTLMAES